METEQTVQTTLPHLVRPKENETMSEALQRRGDFLQRQLQKDFGAEYAVTADKMEAPTDKWNFEVKVRKGLYVGAEVRLTWSNKQAKILNVDVDKSTQIGMYIAMGTIFPAFVIGVAMGAFDMPPFDFGGGTKIGALLAGLAAAVPGLVLMLILRAVLMGKHKEENKVLKRKVFDWAKLNYVDRFLQFYLDDKAPSTEKE